MELRHIRYFIALAEELNFRRAAERLNITQPPLSRQIRELEEEVGVQLFYRTKRSVELTSAGKMFLKKTYQILDQVEQAYVTTRLSSTGIEGELRVGFTGSVYDLIPTIRVYRERFPKVGIILNHMSTTEQMNGLLENIIDLGVVSGPAISKKIETYPLLKLSFMAVLSKNHFLASRESIYMRDLVNETFITTPKSAGILYYDKFMSAFEKVGFIPKITMQANDHQTVLALVAAGLGVTLAPSPINPLSGTVQRKIEDFNETVNTSIAWRKDNRSDILEKFLTFFTEFYHSDIHMK